MTHIKKVVGRLMVKNVDAVATDLMTEKVDKKLSGWQPDADMVDAAMECAATASIKDAVKRVVEHSLCKTSNQHRASGIGASESSP